MALIEVCSADDRMTHVTVSRRFSFSFDSAILANPRHLARDHRFLVNEAGKRRRRRRCCKEKKENSAREIFESSSPRFSFSVHFANKAKYLLVRIT
jgi:hypothetical protein